MRFRRRSCRRYVAGIRRGLRNTPWTLLIAAAVLLLFGWAAIHRFETLHRESHFFFRRQLVWSVLAALAALLVGFGPWRRVHAWAYPLYIVSLLLLLLVFFFPPVNGAHRWIRIGPAGFQPSELAKLAVVLVVARLLAGIASVRWRDILAPAALTSAAMILVAAEPDLGTALVLAPVFLTMLFVRGAKKRQIAALVLIGAAAAPLLWMHMSGEQRSRVTALFEETVPGKAPSDDAYQLYQGRRTFAFGGVFGSLLGEDAVNDLDAFPLPEGQGDFILCSVAERFGLLGVAIVFAAYSLYVYSGLRIVTTTEDTFAALAAIGLVAIIAVQVVVNAGMLAGLLPITGLPLPFLSYGGSSLLIGGVSVGLLVHFGRRASAVSQLN